MQSNECDQLYDVFSNSNSIDDDVARAVQSVSASAWRACAAIDRTRRAVWFGGIQNVLVI